MISRKYCLIKLLITIIRKPLPELTATVLKLSYGRFYDNVVCYKIFINNNGIKCI